MRSDIIIQGLTILAPVDSPNTDGIDPEKREKAMWDSILDQSFSLVRIYVMRTLTSKYMSSCYLLYGCSVPLYGIDSYAFDIMQPNCYSRVISVNVDEHIIIFSKRDIKQWEELTYDYRFTSSPNEAEGAIANDIKTLGLLACSQMQGLQFGSAGMFIFAMDSIKKGMSHYVFIVYRNAIASVSLAPFAFVLERKVRPKMTFRVFLEIMALAFFEIMLDQCIALLGMKFTSASFLSAVMNSAHSVTFVMAVILR
ncbi:WAT1-related protein [Glycine soja]